ncbi:MAG: DUF4157 domain-containing protein [Gammaproteobacteria bacterium]|nr:DUF4157 domain-containing protein [Gammaproteobacteria bacterium]MDH5653601.1 DUF4157 domain-containing protein [Gammaproteobacteria bacterium]
MRTYPHKSNYNPRPTSASQDMIVPQRQALGNTSQSLSNPSVLTADKTGDFEPSNKVGNYDYHFANLSVISPGVQRKPLVSSPGDRLEQEADTVADHIMKLDAGSGGAHPGTVQRMCSNCKKEEDEANNPPGQSISISAGTGTVARQAVEGQEEEDKPYQQMIFRTAAFSSPQTGAVNSTAGDLSPTNSGGEALAGETGKSMENMFGFDFSKVRIHRDAEAGTLSKQYSAKAFTYRNHIYFGQGMYNPENSEGKHLLAHELTHVVQQGHATKNNGIMRSQTTKKEPNISSADNQAAKSSVVQRAATWGAERFMRSTIWQMQHSALDRQVSLCQC